MMAMFLKLESAANAESSSGTQLAAFFGTAGLPDFMAWNSVEKLPWWWEPFHHVWFMIPAILIIPAALAFFLGYANFRRRVSGVYFAIVTLSVSAIMAILIIGQQGLTGGINGITDFKTFLGMDLDNDRAKLVMYFITAVLLLCIVAAGQFILRSRLGRVLVAIRDGGDRGSLYGLRFCDVPGVRVCCGCNVRCNWWRHVHNPDRTGLTRRWSESSRRSKW